MSNKRRQKLKNTITIRQIKAAACEAMWKRKFRKDKVEKEAYTAKREELRNRLGRRIVAMQMARQKKRHVKRWKDQEVVIPKDQIALIAQSNKEDQSILDSGTSLHMHREKDAFQYVTATRVNIRGVAGKGVGYKGILRPNRIGATVPAIWYEQLPVKMLISTEGLKRDAWETHFGVQRDEITNVYTGAVIPITKGPSGLPTVADIFASNEEEALVCSSVAELEVEDMPTFNVQSLPKGVRGAIKESISKAQKVQRTRTTKARMSKLLEHRRMCHFHECGNQNVVCHDCQLFKGKRKGHEKERAERFKSEAPLLIISTDFFGPVEPVSYAGSRWAMLFVEDKSGFAYAEALKKKPDAPEELERFVKKIRRKSEENAEPMAILVVLLVLIVRSKW